MGHHCCTKQKVKRGLWSPEEDEKLIQYITIHGHGCWSSVPKQAGLQRCGKSCRLRWINYLRPDLKRGSFSAQEERIIIDVHRILGNRWAQIAKHLPGRTDNEVKNFWNSCIKKKLIAQGLDPKTHNLLPNSRPSTSNISQFHNPLQSSTVPFTISSSGKGFDSLKNTTMSLNPPFITLPPPPANNVPLQEGWTMTVPPFEYENPSVLMSFRDQNSHNSFEFTDGSSSSAFDHQNVFMDENCMWRSGIEPLEPLQQGELQMQQGQVATQEEGERQGQPIAPNVSFNEANENKGINMDNYDCTAFDLELIESALSSCGVFCNESSLDNLRWNC